MIKVSIYGLITISANNYKGLAIGGIVVVTAGLLFHLGKTFINENKGCLRIKKEEAPKHKQSDYVSIKNVGTEQSSYIEQSLPPAKTFAEELKGSSSEDVEETELLGKFIHAGDICLFCAPTNVGKSLLVAQFGFDSSNGYATKLIPNSKAGQAQQVFLYDKEGRTIDLIHRYGKMDECVLNNKKFLRPPCSNINNLEKLLIDIQGRVRAMDVNSIVIVDNITVFTGSKSTKSVNNFCDGLVLLREEQEKKKLKVTFLLVTHTDKHSAAKNDIHTQDILGSGNLSNLANSILYLEKTGVNGERKLRCGKNKFTSDGENDLIIKLVSKPYLHFEYVCYANEKVTDKLARNCDKKNKQVQSSESTGKKKVRGKKVTDEEIFRMKELQEKGASISKIAEEMGRCRKTIGEYLSKGITTPTSANLVTC